MFSLAWRISEFVFLKPWQKNKEQILNNHLNDRSPLG